MARPTENKVYGARPLLFGCKDGLDIWNLQVKLVGWGSGSDNDGIGKFMDPVRLTGAFDATTRDAVMRFQKGHKLPIDGAVDSAVFAAIDREVAQHPVLIHSLRCPCVTGANDGAIVCRCTAHPGAGSCKNQGGFGKARSAGEFLLDGKTLADTTALGTEKLDLYDMQEYAGMDKAVIWAVRALMHRSELQFGDDYSPVQVTAGYRCWEDNYHHADDIRWHHRRSTFHFGKAIEFYVLGNCTEPAWKNDVGSCPECDELRKAALEKCGFQSRWHEPGRMSVAEGKKKSRPPVTPFGVQVDTVRLHPRKSDHALEYTDHFAKTDKSAAEPLYGGTLANLSFPIALEQGITDAWPLPDDAPRVLAIRRALDPLFASGEDFFRNTETAPRGWFPLGVSRIWHGGVHLYADKGTPVHAIAPGEIVGCRAGDDESQPNGSRNFVLIRHTIDGDDADKWKGKVFWSLYMHLDAEAPAADAKVRWRREFFERSKKCVEALVPTPFLEKKQVATKDRLVPKRGLSVGETHAITTDAAIDGKTIDDLIPDTWKIVKLDGLVEHYIFTTEGADNITEIRDALATVDDKKVRGFEKPIRVSAGEVIGMIAEAPTADAIKDAGAFFHLETFSEAKLPVENFTDLTVAAADKMADRAAAVAALAAAKLIPAPPDTVLTAEEIKMHHLYPPYSIAMRSALVQMPSCWSVDWKAVFAASKSLGFLSTPDAITDDWNTYNWWTGVSSGNGKLPADNTKVFHYHPISLILQLAYR